MNLLDIPTTELLDYETLDADQIRAGYYAACYGEPEPTSDMHGRAFRQGYREARSDMGLGTAPSMQLLIYRYCLGMSCYMREAHHQFQTPDPALRFVLFPTQ